MDGTDTGQPTVPPGPGPNAYDDACAAASKVVGVPATDHKDHT